MDVRDDYFKKPEINVAKMQNGQSKQSYMYLKELK
jgi:hypothetical protein